MPATLPDFATETASQNLPDFGGGANLPNFDETPAPVKISATPVFQPSQFSSGHFAPVPAADPENAALLTAIAEDPKGFVKSLASSTVSAVSFPGKLAYLAAADVVSKAANDPEYGGNLAALANGQPLPVDKFLGTVAQTNPKLAVTGKVGKSLAEMAPLGVVGMMPAWAARLTAAGFSAQMIAGAPEQFKQYADEINKPPDQQDPDKLTTLQSDILQTFVFAPLAGGGAAHGVGPKFAPGRFIRDTFGPPKVEPKTGTPYVRKPMEWNAETSQGETSNIQRPTPNVEPAAPVPAVMPVPAAPPAALGDQRRLDLLRSLAKGEPIAGDLVRPGEESLLEPAGYVRNSDGAWVRQSALDANQPQIGAPQLPDFSTVPKTTPALPAPEPSSPATPKPAASDTAAVENPLSPETITGSNVQKGTEMPAEAGGSPAPEAIVSKAETSNIQHSTPNVEANASAPFGKVEVKTGDGTTRITYSDKDGNEVGYGQLVGDVVNYISVDPKFQRKGFGKAILKDLINRGGKIGVAGTPEGLALSRSIGAHEYAPNRFDFTASSESKSPQPGDVTGKFQKSEQPAQPGANPSVEPATPKIKVGRGLTVARRFNNETDLTGPDILSFIKENGGMLSKSAALKSWGKEKFNANKSLWNDAPDNLPPHHNIIYGGRMGPDRIAQAAFEAGVIREPGVNTLWDAVRKASGARRKAIATAANQDKLLKVEAKQHEEWTKAVQDGKEQVVADQLAIGDVLDVEGERVRVVEVDPDTGDVVLEDGKRFGRQVVPGGKVLYVEAIEGVEGPAEGPSFLPEDEVPPVKAETSNIEQPTSNVEGKASVPFQFEQPETVAEQKARLAAEAEARRVKAEKQKLEDLANRKLKGNAGDLGQKSFLPGDENLFASPRLEAGADLPPEPPRTAPPVEDNAYHSVMDATPLGMQEGVKLIKTLIGNYPRVVEQIRALGGRAAGVFKHSDRKGTASIELLREIFDVVTSQEKADLRQRALEYAKMAADHPREIAAIAEERYKFLLNELRQRVLPERHSVEALKVLFHEIGHLIDWLPDHLVRGRGNFFGHVAALKNNLSQILPIDLHGPMGGRMNDAAKARLRAEALRQMREEVGPFQEIIRQIIVEEPEWKITGVTPEDVTNILRENAGSATPELTRWFAEQNSKVKAEVLRKAMKGLLDERLAALGKKTQVGTRKVTREVRETSGREPTQAEIKARFGELLNQEMIRRNTADLELVKQELLPAIAWWRGVAEVPAYFRTAHEMYAEAFSMFFNNPAGLLKHAPITARLLFNYMERRPEVGKLYDTIQNQIKSSEIQKVRVNDLHEMWQRDNENSLKAARENLHVPWRDYLENVRYHIDRMSGPIYQAARRASNSDRLKQAWGDFNYRGAEHERYFSASNRDVATLLVKHNLDWNHDFGEYLYHNRVLKERFNPIDGTPLANPLGWDVKDSTARLAEMRQQLGPERWSALEEAARRFYELHQNFVVKPLLAGRMFSPELAKVLAERTAYATFAAARNLPDKGIERIIETQFGTGATPHIYRQVGNLGEIKNPGTATMLKGASLISALARNTMKRELVRALQETEQYPGELIRPAEVAWNGKATVPRIVDGPKASTILYLEDGQVKAFYTRKLLADAVNGDSPVANHAASTLQSAKGLLKGLFTQQPGFWAFNFVRDTAGFWAQMPGLRAPVGWARAFPRAVVGARASVTGRENPYAEAALKRRMLISRMEQAGSWAEVSNEWEHRVSAYGFDPASWNKELTATERALKIWHSWMGWGKTIERANKLAGMIYLDEYAPPKYRNAPEYLKREWVRSLAGSPDFLERGKSANSIDWMFLFYNPWKEGVRSLVSSVKTDPLGAAAKATALMIAPTVLQAMAYNGAFGPDLQKRYRSVGLYDLTNYLIPYASPPDKNGGVGIFRLPLFEPHRILHGVLFQLLTGQSEGMLSHAGGQLPGLNPIVTSAYQWGQYLMGENPFDFFRGANVLTDQQQAARGGAHGRPGEVWNAAALGQMGKQTWNNLGGTVLYRFQNLNLENPPATTAQQIVNLPVVNNILGRWYKVTNAGITDRARLAAAPVAQQEAEFNGATQVMLEKITEKYWPALEKGARGVPLAPEDYATIRQPIEWTPAEKALMAEPAFQEFMFLRQAQIKAKLQLIIMARLNPQYKALENIGASRMQQAAILRDQLGLPAIERAVK